MRVEVEGGEDFLEERDGLEELDVELHRVAVQPQRGDDQVGHAVGALVRVEQEEVGAEAVVGEEARAALRVEQGFISERDDRGFRVDALGRIALCNLCIWSV